MAQTNYAPNPATEDPFPRRDAVRRRELLRERGPIMRVFIAFLMLVLTVGVHGQAVSRNELKNTNTQIDARMALKANTTALVTASNAIAVRVNALNTNANVVYVTKSGSDTTGMRGNREKPFLSIGAAKTNALVGDTILVSPGIYNETDLIKIGVNLYFDAGAIVRYTGTSIVAIFDDWSGDTTNIVSGFGEFYNYTTTTNATANLGTVLSTNGLTYFNFTGNRMGGSFTNTEMSSVINMVGGGADSIGFPYSTMNFTTIELTGSSFFGGYSVIGIRGYAYLMVNANNINSVSRGVTWRSAQNPYTFGELWVNCDRMVATMENVNLSVDAKDVSGNVGDTATMWLKVSEMESRRRGNIVITNYGKLYLSCQKIFTGDPEFNRVTNVIVTGHSVVWISADKFQTGGGPGFYIADGDVFVAAQNFLAMSPVNSLALQYPLAWITGGTNRFVFGELQSPKHQDGFNISGGITTLSFAKLGVSSTNSAIKVSGGNVEVFGGSISGQTNIHVSAGVVTGSYVKTGLHGDVNGNPFLTNFIASILTNANQFGAAGETLTLKKAARQTNGLFYQEGGIGVYIEAETGGSGRLIQIVDTNFNTVFTMTSNALVGLSINNPTNTFDVNGHTSLRSNLFLPNRPTNSAPDAFLAIKDGRVVDTAAPAGGSGLSSFKSNNVAVLASPTILETTNGPGNVSAFSAAIGSDTVKTYWTVDSGVTQGMNTAIVALQAGSGGSITPFYRPNWTTIYTNFAIGSDSNIWIDMDRSYILSVTNVCNGCKVHVVLTNSGAYNYSWYNVAGSTNRIEWQNEAAPVSTAPATDAGLYSVYLQGTATNVMGWYYPPRGTANIVAKTVTTSGGITNTSASAAIESAAGFRATRAAGSATPGEVSIDSTNGFVLSIQAGLMGSNVYFFAPTNVPVGLTDPVLTVSNLVHGAGGWTGTLAFASRSVLLNGAQPTNTILTQLAGLLATNQIVFTNDQWLLTRGSNGVVVAITGPSFATVSSSGSGGVQTFTLTASAALGNWQGNPYVAYTNIPVTTATTVNGAGNGSTNYLLTLSSIVGSVNSFNLGSSNVNIYTVAGSTLGSPIAWRAAVTNLSANNWGIRFDSLTNRWRFSGVYGTNAPTVLTNGTALWLAGESDGTNTVVGYTYFAPGL